MAHTFLSRTSLAATISLLTTVTAASQDGPPRFVVHTPMVRFAACDAPALFAALPGMHLGRLFAEPEVAAAILRGRENYAAKVARWTRVVDRLVELDPSKATMDMMLQRQLFDLDWRDLRSGDLAAVPSPEGFGIQTVTSIEPVPAAEGRLAQRFEQLANRLRAMASDPASTANLQVAADKIDGYPGLVLTARDDQHAEDDFPRSSSPGAWMLHLPGQFAGGDGRVELAGACRATAVAPPGIELEVHLRRYLELIGQVRGSNESANHVLQLLGLDTTAATRWRLRPAGELLLDEISLEMNGKPGGVLGALLDGATPLLEQPLPEHGMVQVRFGFDVPALLEAVDGLLEQASAPTLADLGLTDDLRRAWTGNVALAVVRPAPGGLVPRMYASFGIADQEAVGRLLARLHDVEGIEPKQVTYEGKPCVQLRLDGAPPALQPSYCLQNGVVHFAESGIGLRAMLKAAANGAPPALDVGDAEAPAGPGAALPGFDLRFDGAAIHAALHELWLPLAETFLPAGSMSPFGDTPTALVPLAEMPDVEVVTKHLRTGRGVLRREPSRVVLSMSGTAGGPEMHALLAAYGPMLSAQMTNSWTWETSSAQAELVKLQLERIGEALQRFESRTGKPPASFGELLAGGDLDAKLLHVEGDDKTEPVLHDGKEVARTSFAFHPEGKKMSPEGEEIVVRVTTLHPFGWRGCVLGADGVVRDYWGEMASEVVVEPIEPVEDEVQTDHPAQDEPKDGR